MHVSRVPLAIGSALAALLLCSLTPLEMPSAAAQNGPGSSPPTLTELPTTPGSHAWFAASPLAAGYVEQEFQMAGTAGLYSYTSPPPPPWSIELAQTQPYTTRLLVRRPADPSKFN